MASSSGTSHYSHPPLEDSDLIDPDDVDLHDLDDPLSAQEASGQPLAGGHPKIQLTKPFGKLFDAIYVQYGKSCEKSYTRDIS
ncbi:hypothetical protein XA68_11164 [Ophiocordyceps unilateralis]|uniref:Uncharacterized protein n=1 Tax=Ophiocordyceps unilateralis TaxID=268505 RepID=A0A2A9P2A2_OPHUN|nr:hypothetical protein XA68_11164 [Ophiocordyceps unilateralis]